MGIFIHTSDLWVAVSLFLLVFSFRCIIVLYRIKSAATRPSSKINGNFGIIRRTRPVKTLVVLGSGGHTTEMLHLLSSISDYDNYQPLNYIIASTDTTSKQRLEAFQKSANISTNKSGKECNAKRKQSRFNRIFKIPRAREVGQPYFTSMFTTIYSIFYTSHIVLVQTQPDLLILNGPGTCLPVVFWTFIARIFGLSEGKIVFCESFCRVKSLSLTGSLLWKMKIVDLFLVHWPELCEKMGNERMILIDSFIQHS